MSCFYLKQRHMADQRTQLFVHVFKTHTHAHTSTHTHSLTFYFKNVVQIDYKGFRILYSIYQKYIFKLIGLSSVEHIQCSLRFLVLRISFSFRSTDKDPSLSLSNTHTQSCAGVQIHRSDSKMFFSAFLLSVV